MLRPPNALRRNRSRPAEAGPLPLTPSVSGHLRHGRPHRIRGWALIKWAGSRIPQRRYLRLVHFQLTVYDGAEEGQDVAVMEQMLVGTTVYSHPRKREIVIKTLHNEKIVVSVRTQKEFDAWRVGFADASRDPADFYTLVPSRRLGEGAFSEVFFGFDRENGDHAAIKVVDKTQCSRSELDHAEVEARVMAFVRHPGIVQCRDIFDGPTSLHVVMEHMSGGTLERRVLDRTMEQGPPPERICAAVMENILSALAYLASEGIVHRDLKPDNILLASVASDELWPSTACISDFGLAAFVDTDNQLKDFVGTPHYVAPEVLVRDADNNRIGYGTQVDVWAAGIILYFLLTGGRLPFDGDDNSAVCRAIRDGKLVLQGRPWWNISNDAKSLVRSLLQPNPATRLTAATALLHPWFYSRGKAMTTPPPSPGPPLARLRPRIYAIIAFNALKRFMTADPPGAPQPRLAIDASQPPSSPPPLSPGGANSLKRPLSKKMSVSVLDRERISRAPERAPVGTDALGYNVGLFPSFAPKRRARPHPPLPGGSQHGGHQTLSSPSTVGGTGGLSGPGALGGSGTQTASGVHTGVGALGSSGTLGSSGSLTTSKSVNSGLSQGSRHLRVSSDTVVPRMRIVSSVSTYASPVSRTSVQAEAGVQDTHASHSLHELPSLPALRDISDEKMKNTEASRGAYRRLVRHRSTGGA